MLQVGVAGLVFANWMPSEWFLAGDEEFARVLKNLSTRRESLRDMVCSTLEWPAAGIFYQDELSTPHVVPEFSSQQLAQNPLNAITALKMNHENEVKGPGFVTRLNMLKIKELKWKIEQAESEIKALKDQVTAQHIFTISRTYSI